MARQTTIGITGATGFIGTALIKRLLEKGCVVKVFVFDKENVLLKGVKVYRGDLISGKGIEKFLENTDIIVHLAGRVFPPDSEMVSGNSLTTYNLVSKLFNSKVKKLIFSSSVAVYGESCESKFKEKDKCQPNTIYGLSKYMAEKIVEWWGKQTGNSYVILRFFSIYGPGNRKGAIYSFLSSYLKTGGVKIYGDGKQKRDLLFVNDAVGAIEKAIVNTKKGIFNVGSGKYYSISDVLDMIESAVGKKISRKYYKAEEGKVKGITYSVQKINNEFRWSSKTLLDEGIKLTLEELKNNKGE